ncbi:MAG: ATP-binding cassette domain-containing protein [Muribaculaceae bacterium]|nr:ATP-binding cassette domain-containing protein [Muribaculaceae bacterium]
MAYLDINQVVKRYEGHTALAGVSMQVPQGCIYGLLGPNGAGKSTLIRIINRIIAADEGTVTLGGKPMTDADIAHIGYLPEERGLYKKMKVGEHIVYLGRLKGMTKADALASMHWWLDRFDLKEWENKKVEALSKGMQQKVQFIATVIHRPPLLIFDEPFSGFDPVNAEQLKVEILALRDQGSTILFSTHNMASVEEICQQITLLNHAQVVLTGSVDEVKQQHKKNIIAVQSPDSIEQNPALFTLLPTDPVKKDDILIKLAQGVQVRDAIAWLNDHYRLTGFTEVLPSMNEIFIETVKSQQNLHNNG